MSTVQATRPSQPHLPLVSVKRNRWRLPVLGVLLLLSLSINTGFLFFPAKPNGPLLPFMLFFIAGFAPYLIASFLVLTTKPYQGRLRWLELALILVGALGLRAMLLSVEPFLSPDSWRYLWDARVTLLGYSPFVYPPNDPIFAHYHDLIYAKMAFHNVPTIYPPGAQVVYLFSYLIAPSNLAALKGIFVVFDMVTCSALGYLLYRRGLDPSRAIIYAWCPLPIIDFSIQGHLDVIAIMFTMLALASNLSTRRGGRILTGFLVGMAVLAKIYPILALVVVVRRRDWALLITCFATIILGYIPYLIMGHGQVFGFFGTYASEQTPNAGLVQHLVEWLGGYVVASKSAELVAELVLDLLLICGASLIILVMRLNEGARTVDECIPKPDRVRRVMQWIRNHLAFTRFLKYTVDTLTNLMLWVIQEGRISMEAGMLILIGMVFVTSSHIFPWYTTALLPLIAVLIQPVWTRREGFKPKGLAVALAWYFPCIIVMHYFFDRIGDWTIYFLVVYDTLIIGISIAAIVGIRHVLQSKKSESRVPLG